MANKKSEGEDVSSAQAVFLGALAPGVNVRIVVPDSLCIIKSSVFDIVVIGWIFRVPHGQL